MIPCPAKLLFSAWHSEDLATQPCGRIPCPARLLFSAWHSEDLAIQAEAQEPQTLETLQRRGEGVYSKTFSIEKFQQLGLSLKAVIIVRILFTIPKWIFRTKPPHKISLWIIIIVFTKKNLAGWNNKGCNNVIEIWQFSYFFLTWYGRYLKLTLQQELFSSE